MGGSDTLKFKTPPAAGSDELSFVIYGDMGKAPLDPSVEHYIQVDGNIFWKWTGRICRLF